MRIMYASVASEVMVDSLSRLFFGSRNTLLLLLVRASALRVLARLSMIGWIVAKRKELYLRIERPGIEVP